MRPLRCQGFLCMCWLHSAATSICTQPGLAIAMQGTPISTHMLRALHVLCMISMHSSL